MEERYKHQECTKNQFADTIVNFLDFSAFGKNKEIDEEMKAAKEAYKQELKDAGCAYDYKEKRYYFTTDRAIDRQRVDECCNKYRDLIYKHNHPNELPKTKDMVVIDLSKICAEETKSHKMQLLLKPSVYEKIKEGADNFGLSVNDYINKVFENLTFEKKNTNNNNGDKARKPK